MGRAVKDTFVDFPKTTEIGFVNLVRGSVLPPCIVERFQMLTNRNGRIDQRVHYRALARGGVGGTNRQ